MMTNFGLCFFVGFITYYSLILGMIWLTIISYDIWRRIITININASFESFRNYAICGFAVPSVSVIFVTIVDLIKILPSKYSLEIGIRRCWLSKDAEGIYIYILATITISLNILMFIMTFFKIWKAHKSADRILISRPALRSRIYTFTRLFMVMGVTWISELFAFIYGWESLILKFFDVYNSLQGALIFITCVLNTSTRKLIIERTRSLKTKQKLNEFPLPELQKSEDIECS
ncbi:hypothetical protein PVAND_012668 [Polypedilum vanderplanki]|uniref:G-protein coupled receptors family 2 profile 2 domain-containing protein n=1 Tax=Polypedilum vanderplanki TaxID=319348 RepID=A0A9J6CNE1_POLVA|nr:hypothetical protein PVAND_012668 [Polypedilum vanderplanki]